MSKISVIIDRFKKLLGTSNDKDIAKVLGVKADTFSQWKGRNKIPYKEINNFCILQNVSLNWIFLGVGEINLEKKISNNQKIVMNGGTNHGNIGNNVNGDNISVGGANKKSKIVVVPASNEEICGLIKDYASPAYKEKIKAKLLEFKRLLEEE